jgi:hypothetical protein
MLNTEDMGTSSSCLQVPGQGLAYGAGFWFQECVSNLTARLLQTLLSHWLLSHSLQQDFVPQLVRPSDVVHAPQAGVE